MSQNSDPILGFSESTVQGLGDSFVDGGADDEQGLKSNNARIEAERLFNIGINLGVSSNEERVSMIEKLIELEEGDQRPNQGEGVAEKRLWVDVIVAKQVEVADWWCVVGDFNSVRAADERRRSGELPPSAMNCEDSKWFNLFIQRLGLIDLPLLGRKFTWVQPNGACMSRLDRILVSPNWSVEWGDVKLWALPRDISDHCPIILRYQNFDWGPKPFRFNNHWLKNKGFKEVVAGSWNNTMVGGRKGLIIKDKLKVLKGDLRRWNMEVYGGVDEKIVMLTKEVERLDLKREDGTLVDIDNVNQKATLLELRHLLHSKDSMLFQRSRSRWLKEGDANTGYFHSCVVSRKRSNVIGALRTEVGWVDKPMEVRREIVGYFKRHFSEVRWRRPTLEGLEFPSITSQQRQSLVNPFSVEEVRSVIEESDGNKCPGPDGFNFAFLKGMWEVICGDVMAFMHEFHECASIPKALSSYFITLIPKVLNPQALGDFRPISLLGCLYKVVAKVLTKRLSFVMDSLVSKNQSAFLKGRLLVDGVLAINEVVDWAKKAKQECLVFKVDFEKAYDSPFRTSKWEPNGAIDISKGLKQGDPLAPFLFILVAEGLGSLMKKGVELGFFKGVKICNSGAIMSHLQYADDTIFVGEACVENLWTTKAILRWFELISGLKVNFFKSKLYGINVCDDFINVAASFFKCKVGKLPFIYLGLPVGANPRRAATWNPVIEVLQKRLASWKNKYVSLGGRVVLLNSVLSAIPIFYLSLFKMPAGVWKKIVSLQRRFLWGGAAGSSKISWVKWTDVCRPKKEGGLGVKDLRIMNISLLAKWKWRLLSEGEAIWKNIIRERYGGGERGVGWMSKVRVSSKASPWWNDLMTIGVVAGVDHLSGIFFKKIGNGGATSFWHDSWVGPQTLKEVFPRLFLVSAQQDSSVFEVAQRIPGRRGWDLKWRRRLFVWEEELRDLLENVLTPIELSNVEDVWKCHHSIGGLFSVNSLYKFLYGVVTHPIHLDPDLVHDLGCLWKSLAPSKVIIFSWQLLLHRLPTRVNLAKRGIVEQDSNSFCTLCPMSLESEEHLFGGCAFASAIWRKVFIWVGWGGVVPTDPVEIFKKFSRGGAGGKGVKGLVAVWHVVVWAIWRARNDLTFNAKVPTVEDVLQSIMTLSWKWNLEKKKGGGCSLYEWKTFPMDCITR
ncbi:hypothetical protein TSUD_159750 [Trifolium subterraneum]|uniref:Reverse transcriptase domain-containing protein n=1 Tax=Trifolium subterraneum TaxID=3900 RepID=A0A2Z6M7H9_TRISU|nr:hypothetical protein TSUD_159750 [Trifolium subterraneum]